MLDPEAFMKNSPFQLAHSDSYKLANTTHELLKFQLAEQARPNTEESTLSLLMDGLYNSNFLQSALSLKDDTETRSDTSSGFSDDSGFSTPTSQVSSGRSVADTDPRSYLNLKVLIENSVFDTSKMSQKAVIPLRRIKRLKQQIANKQQLKDYLTERISVSNQFCTALFSSHDTDDNLDPKLLVKILKQTVNLQVELIAMSQELEALEHKLNNHNMACLGLGYVEDLKLSALSAGSRKADPLKHSDPLESPPQHALDALFAHVASLAAQKNIPLPHGPAGDLDSFQAKVAWATRCIDLLLELQPSTAALDVELFDTASVDPIDNSVVRDHSFLSGAPLKAYGKAADDNKQKTLAEYKLALDDLRFSHQYFMKEYENLKENSVKTILEYRRKNLALEKEVARLKNSSCASLIGSSRDLLEAKDKEIAQLRRAVNEYKIECMGTRSHAFAGESLLTPDSADSDVFPPIKPQGTSVSNAILRKEFKKIVADIQDQYEIELEEERFQRRAHEEKLLQLELT